jgi:hypothetical protein
MNFNFNYLSKDYLIDKTTNSVFKIKDDKYILNINIYSTDILPAYNLKFKIPSSIFRETVDEIKNYIKSSGDKIILLHILYPNGKDNGHIIIVSHENTNFYNKFVE